MLDENMGESHLELIELWHKGLKDAPHRVAVVPGLESSVRPWISGTPVGNTLATLYGFAASGNHRGADGVSLFNRMDVNDWPGSGDDEKGLVKHGVAEQIVPGGARQRIAGGGSARARSCARAGFTA